VQIRCLLEGTEVEEMLGSWDTLLPARMQQWGLDRAEVLLLPPTHLPMHPPTRQPINSPTHSPTYPPTHSLSPHRVRCRPANIGAQKRGWGHRAKIHRCSAIPKQRIADQAIERGHALHMLGVSALLLCLVAQQPR
jgi:hypothetical protein